MFQYKASILTAIIEYVKLKIKNKNHPRRIRNIINVMEHNILETVEIKTVAQATI